MQSVSGGGHWGGGVWASSRDHARFGLLHLRRGRWGKSQVLSEGWVDEATAPGDVNPVYGYMWWRNAGRELWPSAPDTSYAALGYGTNLIWVSPEHDLVVVARWIERDAVDGFLGLLIESTT
jgi:CubicO group peptidase (beta-lactamase class C family)